MTGKRKKRSLTRLDEADPNQMPRLEAVGGRLNILSDADMARIHEASLTLLGDFGMSDAPRSVTDMVCPLKRKIGSPQAPNHHVAFSC